MRKSRSTGGSPCFWLPLSFQSGTHVLDKTRGYRLPVPVNGSLRYDDYVQPRAPGTRLSRDPIAKQKRGLKQIKNFPVQNSFPSLPFKTPTTAWEGAGTLNVSNKIIRLGGENTSSRYRGELLTHFVLPAVLWRHLWNQDPVGSTGQSAHQSQVAEKEARVKESATNRSGQSPVSRKEREDSYPQCRPITSSTKVRW